MAKRSRKKSSSRTLLTARELAFVAAYQGNGSKTARELGMGKTRHGQEVNAWKMMNRARVAMAIEKKWKKVEETVLAASVKKGVKDVLSLLDAFEKHKVNTERLAKVVDQVLRYGDNPKAPRTPMVKALLPFFAPPEMANATDIYPPGYMPIGGVVFNYKSKWAREKEAEIAGSLGLVRHQPALTAASQDDNNAD